MFIRKATQNDIDQIVAIYDAIHTEEEAGRSTTGWIRGIYPIRSTAEASVAAGEMFVREIEGRIVAAGRINQVQDPAYARAIWSIAPPDDQIMVLHTLVVSPEEKGKGYGRSFVKDYEAYARTMGCPYLRLDTNQRNTPARTLYASMGYQEASVVPCQFQGLDGIMLLCLEKAL